MGRRKVTGTCHLCGNYGPLSFEHVPPRSAFNSNPVYARKFDEIIGEDSLSDVSPSKGVKMQRGNGGYTLCGKCNNDTGAWYGNAYLDWAWQGMRFSEYSTISPSIHFTFNIFPLRIIKQIICMLFSVNHDGFHKAQRELQRFVMDKERKYLDPRLKVYAYHSRSEKLRNTGIVAQMELGRSGPRLYSEVSFPPWGYLFCIDSPPTDKRLIDISFFSGYGYNDWKEITLNIPVLPVETWIPGDYRSREEVANQVSSSIEEEEDNEKF